MCENSNQFIMVMGWIIPFLLGLLASFIIDFFRNKSTRKQKKEMVLVFLKNQILEAIPIIIKDAEALKNKLINNLTERTKVKACECFNTVILDSVSQTDYYLIFKKEKYVTFVEVYSMIKFIGENLPLLVYDDYINKINLHLKGINKTGDIAHINECLYCKDEKECALVTLEFRINELNKLKTKIEKLISV